MIIEVKLRPEFTDVSGADVMRQLGGLGLKSVHGVSSSQLYDICGSFTGDQINKAAVRLLCDPVTQKYNVLKHKVPNSKSNFNPEKKRWRVEVWLKSSVTDTVGESVGSAMEDIGLPKPQSVRYGVAYCVDCGCSRAALERAIRKSIVNPLIQNCSIS